MKEENLKCSGKGRLKPFNNKKTSSSKSLVSLSYSVDVQEGDLSEYDSDNKGTRDEGEDLYKSLLNEDLSNTPSTSQEKGTMTDPSLQKKKQPVNKSVSTGNSSLQNVLQSISENKADNKVPVVMLSKPVALSKRGGKSLKNSMRKGRVKNFLSLDSLKSSSESSESESEHEKLKKDSKVAVNTSKPFTVLRKNTSSNTTPSKSLLHHSENELTLDYLSDSSSSLLSEPNHHSGSLQLSPDFKGFSTVKVNPKYLVPESKKVLPNEKKISKKLFREKGNAEDKFSTDTKATVLDHPYSHGNPEKVRTTSQSSDGTLVEKDYRFVSRSVFGSPTSSKNPPDIMLHNDKINILRQMSQVFNDEKNRAGPPLATKPTPDSSLLENNNLIPNPICKSDVSAKSLDLKSSNTKLSDQKFTCQKPTNQISKDSKPSVKSQQPQKTICPLADKENLLVMKQSKTKDAKDSVNSQNDICEEIVSQEDKTASPLGSPVHLVSSYSLDKNESIMIKSYKGSKGEDIDIVDGFTFVSFDTEEKMMNYVPTRTFGKLKKKPKRKLKAKKIVKKVKPQEKVSVSEESYDASSEMDSTVNSLTDKQFEGFFSPPPIPSKSNNVPTIMNVSGAQETKKDDDFELQKEKPVLSSAFASNDLDEYLTEHSQLKISFDIPKCRATEDGVTKFDENGQPLETPPPHPKPVHEKSTSDSPLSFNYKLKQTNTKDSSSELKFKCGTYSLVEPKTKNVATPVVALSPTKNTSLPTPVNSKVSDQLSGVKNLPKSLAPAQPKTKNGSRGDLFVKRGGNLLPLSSVFKKRQENTQSNEKPLEMIYIYHSGRLLTLAGSLTKVDPCNSGSIKATVALPRGHGRLIKHTQRVSSRKVKAVEINEDMAKFALSALKTPTKEGSTSPVPLLKPVIDEKVEETLPVLKPSKENILDILTAKFSLDKESKLDPLSSEPSNLFPRAGSPFDNKNNVLGSRDGEGNTKKDDLSLPSKIRWNQDDILKKKDSGHSTEQSKAFRKNINRFPSLSREMKRLNMNLVTYNEESNEETDSSDEVIGLGPCSNSFCSLGCICDSLKCRRKSPEHCGKVDCMFQCNCAVGSWKDRQNKDIPINILSAFNAEYDKYDNLAVKEKDFKKTVVQTGSDVFLLGGEKKKRDIKIPQRFRDTNIWKSPNSSPLPWEGEGEDDASEQVKKEESIYILPKFYKRHIREFRLNVPWYDVKGVSVWCMIHSCYDCYCLTDPNFYGDSDGEDVKVACSSPSISPCGVLENTQATDDTLPTSLTENKIVCFNLKFKALGPNTLNDEKRKWTLKHWIHNANLFSARTCGYLTKNKVVKDIGETLKEGYSLPLPKTPFIMGITLKKTEMGTPRKKPDIHYSDKRKKAIFFDGLGPGLTLPQVTNITDEIFAKLTDRNQCLSNIFLKTFNKIHPGLPPVVDSGGKEPTSDQLPTETRDPSKDRMEGDLEEVNVKSVTGKVGNNVDGEMERENLVGEATREKSLSLYEMIKEEEKRGELELDLSPKQQGEAILVTESRFRKLINMNIIGVIGLNKAGRCIINTVKSSEDLIKMQKIQQLISTNLIDVGPNMKEIFSPSPITEQRVRYVMIRCDASERWEIVGVVQRKNKESDQTSLPKPKRQKTSKGLASPVQSNVSLTNVFKLKNRTDSVGNLCSDLKQADHAYSTGSNVKGSVTTTSTGSLDVLSQGHEKQKESYPDGELPIVTLPDVVPHRPPQPIPILPKRLDDSLVFDKGDVGDGLPRIASVLCGSDPEMSRLMSSPPKVSVGFPSTSDVLNMRLQPQQGVAVLKHLNPSSQVLTSYVLNQPSAKVFGYNSNIPLEVDESFTSHVSKEVPGPFRGIIQNTLLDHHDAKEFPSNSADNHFRGTLRIDKTSLPSQTHISQPPAINSAGKILLYPKQPSIVANGVKVAFPSVSQRPQTANSSPPVIGDALSGGEKIKMLLVPSTTLPGKSLLMPTFSDVPVSCTFVLRKPNEMTSHQNSSPTILPQALPLFSPSPVIPSINSKMSLAASGSTTFKPITCIQTSASNRPPQPVIPFRFSTSTGISGAQTQSSELNVLTPETSRVPISCIPTTSGGFQFLSSGMPVPLASVHNPTSGMQVQSTGVQAVPGAIQNAKTGAQVLSGKSIQSSNGDVLVNTASVQFSSSLGCYSGTSFQTTLTTALSSDSCLNSGAKINTFPLILPTCSKSLSNPVPSTINSLTHSSNVVTVSSPCKSTSVPTESTKGSILSTVSSNPTPIVQQNDRSMSPLIEEEVLEKHKLSNSTSPDVKCISVNKCNNCTAVDLSIRFRSIKLHWLSGTIKKDVMLNIFRMSKKINAPVSLSAKNDVTHSSFLGMFCYCETASDQVYPVLILGTRVLSVLAASKMSPKEIFRSNTIKYLIKEESGELSSYTYDVRGINLIKIASKKKEPGSKVHGLGEKIPVELMRESSILLDQIPHESSTFTNSKFKDEEIVISDDSDHESETRNGKTVPVETGKSATLDDIPDRTFFKPAERVISPDSIKLSTVKHKEGTKSLSSPVKEIKSVQIHSFEEEKNPTCSSGDNFLNAGEHQKRSSKLSKLVLKVPNPFKRPLDQELHVVEPNTIAVKVDELLSPTSIFETEDYEKDPLETKPSLAVEGETQSLNPLGNAILGNQRLQECDATGSSLPLIEVMKGETPSSVRVVSNISTPCNNIEVESFQRGYSPQKPPLVRYSDSQQPHSVQLLSPKRSEKEKMHIPILQSSSVIKGEDNASSISTSAMTGKPSPSSSSHVPEEIIDIEGDFELSLSDFIQSHLSDKGNLTDKLSGVKRRLVPTEKPCPLSKKPLHKRMEYASIQNQPEKSSLSKPSKSKLSLKSVAQSNNKVSRISSSSNSGGRSQSVSNPPGGSFGQEFQQVLSGAPQFWLMDNPEKHNTLERIRRKGLARMLENLYSKVNLISNVGRLPPKHVVLKEAEKLILDQRANDVELAKMEILLREKKTQLLNALSELLKDADEDVQHQFEQWISKNISNPTAKTKFEESWKPQNVVFEDEHILTSSCGKLVVSGADITSYFATHTAGFSPKSPSKYKSIKGLPIPRGRKFPFPLPSASRHTQPSQTLKNKLSQLIRSPKPAKRLPLSPNFISPSFPSNESADDPDEVEENPAISPDPVEDAAEDDNDPWVDFISSSGQTHPWRSAGSEEKDNCGEEMMMNLRNCDLALSDSSSSFDTAPDLMRSAELERSEDGMKLSSSPSPR